MNSETYDLQFLRHAQHPSGAYPACPSFSQYPHCWLRDGSFTAYGMDLWGAHPSARAFHLWVNRTLEPHLGHMKSLIRRKMAGENPPPAEMLPARFSLGGEWLQDGWPNFQLDGYGQWLWSLRQHLRLSGEPELPELFRPVVHAVARYLEAFYRTPCSDCWEEKPDQTHTATLASIYGGLQAVAAYYPEFSPAAEAVRRYILENFVHQGRFVKSDGDQSVDSSLLWVSTPFGVVPPSDPRMRATVLEIRRTLLRGGGLIRYAEDEYYGAGAWLLLTDCLAWHLALDGQPEQARRYHRWVEEQRQQGGQLPEQVAVPSTDPARLENWTGRWGPSASPLLWSHAMHLVAAQALGDKPVGKAIPTAR